MKKEVTYDVDLPNNNVYDEKCPIIYALDVIGQKWKLPIIWYLFKKDVTRYSELKKNIKGITNMMLSKCLKELELSQLITRKQYDIIPPKVEYSLTGRGKALIPTLNELYTWGNEQMEIEKNWLKTPPQTYIIFMTEVVLDGYDFFIICKNIRGFEMKADE